MLQAYDLPQPILDALEALKLAASNYYEGEKGIKKIEYGVSSLDKELTESQSLDRESGGETLAELQRQELGERGGRAVANLYMAFKQSYSNGGGAFEKFIDNLETLSEAKPDRLIKVFKNLFESFWQNPEMYGSPKTSGPLAFKEVRRLFQKNGFFKQWFDRVNVVHWKVIPFGRPGDAINDFRDNYRCSLIKETLTNFREYNKVQQKRFKFLGIDFNPPSEKSLSKRYEKVWKDFFEGDETKRFEQEFRQQESIITQKLEQKQQELTQAKEALAPLEEQIKSLTMQLLAHFPNTQEIIDKLYSIYQSSDLTQTAIEARTHLHNAYNKIQLPSYEEYAAQQEHVIVEESSEEETSE